jgi:hypothetical protein
MKRIFPMIVFIAVMAAFIFPVGCASDYQVEETRHYIVEMKGDIIRFEGLDDPAILADRDNDIWQNFDKVGRLNTSKNQRCLLESKKALIELEKIARSADTMTLIRSIRPYYNNYLDCYISRDGNKVIARELGRRMPLPPEVLAAPAHAFTGISGDLPGTLGDFIDDVKPK